MASPMSYSSAKGRWRWTYPMERMCAALSSSCNPPGADLERPSDRTFRSDASDLNAVVSSPETRAGRYLAFHALFPSVGRRVRDEETQTGGGFRRRARRPRGDIRKRALGFGPRVLRIRTRILRVPAPATRCARGARRPDQLASTWLDLLIRGGTAESTPPGLGDCVRAPAGSDDSPLGLAAKETPFAKASPKRRVTPPRNTTPTRAIRATRPRPPRPRPPRPRPPVMTRPRVDSTLSLGYNALGYLVQWTRDASGSRRSRSRRTLHRRWTTSRRV